MPIRKVQNFCLRTLFPQNSLGLKHIELVELVPRLRLGTDIERLCLALSSEAEPLNGHSQAEPGNE